MDDTFFLWTCPHCGLINGDTKLTTVPRCGYCDHEVDWDETFEPHTGCECCQQPYPEEELDNGWCENCGGFICDDCGHDIREGAHQIQKDVDHFVCYP